MKYFAVGQKWLGNYGIFGSFFGEVIEISGMGQYASRMSVETSWMNTPGVLRSFNRLANANWKAPKSSQFWRVCDSIDQVCAGWRRCAVRRDFSMLTSG